MGQRRTGVEDPCERLADRLREQGDLLRASWLAEVVPSGPVTDDDHLPLMVTRLQTLVLADEVGDALRTEARRLLVGIRDLPSVIEPGGRVFLTWIEASTPRTWPDLEWHEAGYFCCWQAFDPDDFDTYEIGPLLSTLDEALEWAYRRSDLISVRPSSDPDTAYWAGAGPTEAGELPLPPRSG